MFGIILSLSCAFIWAISLILLKLSSNNIPGHVLNLGKNTLGLILLVPTALIIEGPLPAIANQDLLAIMASGFLGIGIADALTLISMRHLKAGEFALLECLLAPCIIVLSSSLRSPARNDCEDAVAATDARRRVADRARAAA